jgi:class 3 adenylate cyclase
MSAPAIHKALPSINATTMMIDLRNFTPNLNAAGSDDAGVNIFCHFLAAFYAECLESCLQALPASLRDEPPLHISSTGDGMIVVFHDPVWHFGHGYLAALLLHRKLTDTCTAYNAMRSDPMLPSTGFGIGIESGAICRVYAEVDSPSGTPVVNTYIGPCINTAARAEGVTKELHRAHTIVCPQLNQLLCEALLGIDYKELEHACDDDTDDATRLAAIKRMGAYNERLCLTFMHLHRLRGLEQPLALYRLSESAATVGNPRYERLLKQLVRDDSGHLAEVEAVLTALG